MLTSGECASYAQDAIVVGDVIASGAQGVSFLEISPKTRKYPSR